VGLTWSPIGLKSPAAKAGIFQSAGLVSTQTIRRGSNRVVLDNIVHEAKIFDAWSDEPWVVDGADVRVSLIAFGRPDLDREINLDGSPVRNIYADLTAGLTDLTKAARLSENLHICFQGPVKVGPFEIDGEIARGWLTLPKNPNGRPNSDVVRPWLNGQDMTRRPSDRWIVDFADMSEAEAALYEAPFEYVRKAVKPLRDANNDRSRRENWWRLSRSGADLRAACSTLKRVIATPASQNTGRFRGLLRRCCPTAE
jgi:type II restriction/modification system DNA methylase subunit YeeA